jgi:prophage regulatory protein
MAMDRLLALREVLALTNLTKSPLYRLIKQGEFPRPIIIGTASRWSELEIQSWIEEKRKVPRDTSHNIKLVHNGNNVPA